MSKLEDLTKNLPEIKVSEGAAIAKDNYSPFKKGTAYEAIHLRTKGASEVWFKVFPLVGNKANYYEFPPSDFRKKFNYKKL